ncbi:alkyl sulfatase BDS1-like metallo-beta-lactamase superfamily hydrolase [Mesorhizobium soli]|uniref:alkyl sulfatase dimerization domain-containing protein n=1 Tax=Pseudaminobacter soli (ex Li et al. 2025) TaxID=1295366 RepID=UPI00247498AD|nr:alkyl sulfatase dimerization domain-containing protein [Mesorhizobium soli]MDH6230768.1 alkyl sulfatase BDS1-like metallo-beta-lactamase superfamily hydrolase [Mesorhizobium soli]
MMNPQELDAIVDRVWNGEAPMEEWTAAVSGGSIKEVSSDVIVVSTGYLFGNVTVIRTEAGLVMIDTGSRETARDTLRAMRTWDKRPIHTVIYTHGHIDHTWGARLLDKEADENGAARPRIIAHRNVLNRFQRYDETQDLNTIIMGRQFNQADYTFPGEHRRPDEVYDEELTLTVGGVRLQLRHGRGETDDATFVWLPEQKVLVSGDFVIWVFPNAGNPRKVQRFANDWAGVLRYMHGLAPAVLVPGHGPVIPDARRAAQLLDDGASALESLVRQTLDLMNGGHSLNSILHRVKPSAELLAKPYLLPKYDDPEFVVRGIWHLYAGWFDGNPAHLKPAADHELGAEIADLAGGVEALAKRVEALCAQGRIRLAASLIEFAVAAAPDDKQVHRVRAAVYRACVEAETSLIGKAIMAITLHESGKRS